MDLKLRGKVAVITGGAKGMGAAITMGYAREGCRVALLGRDVAALEEVAGEARDLGIEIIVRSCDVVDAQNVSEAMASVVQHFGTVDILVNVAGGSGPVGVPAWETEPDAFDEIVQLNMKGCFNTMRAVLPVMIARRSGKIVNVGGTFGMRGRAGRMAYSASKWGLRGITKSTAIEAGPYNINVNCVAPGMVDGPRFREKVVPSVMRNHGVTAEEAVASHAKEYALRRISESEDVASACLFLSSDVSRQITGVDLPVDGGWAML